MHSLHMSLQIAGSTDGSVLSFATFYIAKKRIATAAAISLKAVNANAGPFAVNTKTFGPTMLT